jgi:bisphosphoglycerate-independent phosphoglycerate mutase (AlkP superfamily)
MHGYLPDYPDSDGILISNKKLKKDVAILQDIAPSILQALGLEVPDHMDGEPLWK